jgi:hypothetical protein
VGVGQKANDLLLEKTQVTEGITNTGSMTTMGQSLREAQRPTRSLVTPKNIFTNGHWNVRTMYSGGAAAQIAKEMKGYQLDILGISES